MPLPSDDYPLGRSDRETRRLMLQHQIYGPLTRRVFESAGIGAGMRVLDLGSGAGDVALLVAEMVGPRGRVVGVDMNGRILETARARAAAAGWENVMFHEGDVRTLPLGTDFDAAVGRFLLMYLPDPAAMLRHLSTIVRRGGILAFHENDFSYPPATFPPTPLFESLREWLIPNVGSSHGAEFQMGTNLFRVFLEAGLPAPELRMEAPVGGGPDWPGYEYLAETARSLLPGLQGMTGVDPKQVDVDTLADRLRSEVVERNGIHMLPLMIGAWARTP
ncbi:MAG TPA: methyltransferase domain-containing protein [Candidatus Eisenbacteria bacterium]|nr:methyltransferase domain-containing protein [Candidatus Eisenbacteria bacterium]